MATKRTLSTRKRTAQGSFASPRLLLSLLGRVTRRKLRSHQSEESRYPRSSTRIYHLLGAYALGALCTSPTGHPTLSTRNLEKSIPKASRNALGLLSSIKPTQPFESNLEVTHPDCIRPVHLSPGSERQHQCLWHRLKFWLLSRVVYLHHFSSSKLLLLPPVMFQCEILGIHLSIYLCAMLSQDSCDAHLERDKAPQYIGSANLNMITVRRKSWSRTCIYQTK